MGPSSADRRAVATSTPFTIPEPGDASNRREEFQMATATPAAELPAHLRPVLQAAAKNLLHHLYGPQGPPWGTPFADLEELVVQLSDTLGSELLHQALQRQAEQPVPEPLRHCPSCGRPTRPADP